MARTLTLEIDGAPCELEVRQGPQGRLTVRLNGVEQEIALEPGGDGLHRLRVGQHTTTVHIARAGRGLRVTVGPRQHAVSVLRGGRLPEPTFAEGELAVSAPMTGVVTEVLVAEGDAVRQGDPLLVIVAMKMNNEIRSPLEAVVRTVHVAVGESAEQGALLVVLEAPR